MSIIFRPATLFPVFAGGSGFAFAFHLATLAAQGCGGDLFTGAGIKKGAKRPPSNQ